MLLKIATLKSHFLSHTVTEDDFTTSLYVTQTNYLSNVINNMDLAETYRTFYPKTKEYMFCSAAHGLTMYFSNWSVYLETQ